MKKKRKNRTQKTTREAERRTTNLQGPQKRRNREHESEMETFMLCRRTAVMQRNVGGFRNATKCMG